MAAIRIPPLPTVNDLLRMYNIRAKKQFSQNFILDPRLLNRIAGRCGNLQGRHVIEVGPGPGGITRSLLGLGATRVAVIEKDPRFRETLQYLNTACGNRLDIHIGDVLSFNMENLFSDKLRKSWNEEQEEVKLIGNLPFNVSTLLLVKWIKLMSEHSNLFSYGRVPLVLTFQHEVAQRIIAPPNDLQRSRLSIVCQNWARCEYEFIIPGGAFLPKPEVDVGVVSIKPLVKPYIDLPFPFVNKTITILLQGKKKNVRNTAANLFPKRLELKLSDKMLELASIEPTRLPISLNMEELNKLCHAYKYLIEQNPSLANYSRKKDSCEELVYSADNQNVKKLEAN